MGGSSGRNVGGRPPKLTEEVMGTILSELMRGNWFSTACKRAGISRETGYAWRRAGKTARKGSLQRRFSDACDLADAQAEIRAVDVVHDEVKKGSLKAAQFLLTRRFGSRWAQKRTVTGTLTASGRFEQIHRGAIAHLHGVVALPAETEGEDSLPVDVALERAGLANRLAEARGEGRSPAPKAIGPVAGAYEPAGAEEDDDEAPAPASRPWNPTRPPRDPMAMLRELQARADAQDQEDEDAA